MAENYSDEELNDRMRRLSIEDEDFLRWFWDGGNGNELIEKLNTYAQNENKSDRIRREKERPTIYVIVLNYGEEPFKHDDVQWKLCKVGFTHCSIQKGSGNRMEQVKKQIILKYGSDKSEQDKKKIKPSVLCVLPIAAVDTTPFNETEKRVRDKIGTPIHKDKAKEQKLPVPTEWVLTTQEHIDDVKAKIKEIKETAGELIASLQNLNPPEVPDEYKNEWC